MNVGDVKSQDNSKGWFYTDTVKDHFFNPRNLVKKDEEINVKDYNGVGVVGAPQCGDMMKIWVKIDDNERIKELKWQTFGCFEKGELISTPNGFIEIENIKIGDEVFNHLGKKTFVEETSKRKFNGLIYTIIPLISKFNTLTLTKEHPLLAIKRKTLKYSGKQKHTPYINVNNKILLETKPYFILAKSLEQGDYLIYQPPRDIKDIKDIDKVELKLLGFYLSEGYFSAEEKSSGYYGVVAFSFNKNEIKYIKELKNLLKIKFEKNPKERIRGNVSEVYICSRVAVRFFDRYCGHMAKNKKIHSDLIHLPIEKQKIFLDYYFKGDGHLYIDKRKNRQDQFIMSTASKQLALQLQQLIARQGFFATVSKRKTIPSHIEGRLIKSKPTYIVSYIKSKKKKSFTKKSKDYFLVPVQKIVPKKYDGFVYNFQVKGENKSYLVRGFAVHNCASAIASTSMLSMIATENGGMKIEDALKIKPHDIVARLNGLPTRKFHCSVLGDKALRAAINDYFRRTGNNDRILVEGARIIDKVLKITDKDIEEAVLDGADTLEKVQHKTKIGVHDKTCIPEVEQLIRFYKEKYFG